LNQGSAFYATLPTLLCLWPHICTEDLDNSALMGGHNHITEVACRMDDGTQGLCLSAATREIKKLNIRKT
jgi:hypothetical protein